MKRTLPASRLLPPLLWGAALITSSLILYEPMMRLGAGLMALARVMR